MQNVGSPPPMRGKDHCTTCCRECHRITPAYAGKSKSARPQGCTFQDHPRLCGEKNTFQKIPKQKLGSPPPMRGKGFGISCFDMSFRITPAYAGKSPQQLILKYRYLGSPPPMRGKAHTIDFCYIISRITPAYAGKREKVQQNCHIF